MTLSRRCRGPALCLGLALSAAAASAQDWSLDGSIAQFFSAETNPGADAMSEGHAVGSRTRLGINGGLDTQRAEWRLSTGVSINAFAGPGADEDESLDTTSPFVEGSVILDGQRYVANASGRFARESTTFTDFSFDPDEGLPEGPDDLLTDSNAVRTRVSANAGLSYTLTPLFSASVDLGASITRYSENDPDLAENDAYNLSLGFTRLVDATSSTGISLSVRGFTADDLQQTESLSFSGSASYSTRFTPSTTTAVSLGLSYTEIEELVFPGVLPTRETETQLSVIGSLSADYRGTGDTRFSFLASQGVRPGEDGDVRNVTSIRAFYEGRLNRRTTLGVAASHSISTELGTSTDEADGLEQVFAVSPELSYTLTEAWTARVGYQFQVRDDDDGTGFNNRVFVEVSRGFNILD